MKRHFFSALAIALFFALPAHATGLLVGQPMRPDTWVPASKVSVTGYSYNNLQSLLDSGTLGGGGSGDSIIINDGSSNAVTDTVEFFAGTGLKWVFAASTPDTATVQFDYSNTPASNSLTTKRCVFSNNGTYGGILCEGAGADDNEVFLQFPVTAGTGGDILVSFPVLSTSGSYQQICMETTYSGVLCPGYAAGTGGVANSAAAGDSATGFFPIGTLELARGGTGAGALSCSGQPVTANGSVMSCGTTQAAPSLDANDSGVNDVKYNSTQKAWFLTHTTPQTTVQTKTAPTGADTFIGPHPGEIYVADYNSSGAVDGADIQAAIDSCGTGFGTNTGGCTLILPKQSIILTNTLTVGTPGGAEAGGKLNITIRGQGACSGAAVPAFPTGGTNLVWGGAQDGTMVQYGYTSRIRWENVCFLPDNDLDAGDAGGATAGYVFKMGVNASDYGQSNSFDNVQIFGTHGPASVSLVSVANDGGGLARFTHDGSARGDAIQAGTRVTIYGTTNYNGTYNVTAANPGSDTFDTSATYVSETLSGATSNSLPGTAHPITAFYITGPGGPPKSLQNDKIMWEKVRIDGTSYGIVQDALQALMNNFHDGQISAWDSAVVNKGGVVNVIDTLVQCLIYNCVVLDHAGQTAAGAGETLYQNIYFESGIGPNGQTLLKICDGYDATGGGGASNPCGAETVVRIRDSYITQLCNPGGSEGGCSGKLLDANMRSGMVIFEGNHFNCNATGGYCGKWTVQANNIGGFVTPARIIFKDNHIVDNHQSLIDAPTLNAGLTLGGLHPSIILENYKTDPDGGFRYNDYDFSGSPGPDEVLGQSLLARMRVNATTAPADGDCAYQTVQGAWFANIAIWGTGSCSTAYETYTWSPPTDVWLTKFCITSQNTATVGGSTTVTVRLRDVGGAADLASIDVADSGGDFAFSAVGDTFCADVSSVVSVNDHLGIFITKTGAGTGWQWSDFSIWGVPVTPAWP